LPRKILCPMPVTGIGSANTGVTWPGRPVNTTFPLPDCRLWCWPVAGQRSHCVPFWGCGPIRLGARLRVYCPMGIRGPAQGG
jgi:hypothetical protein